MIVAPRADRRLAAALRLAARPDEDVVVDPADVERALHRGFPRIVVVVEGEWAGRDPAPALQPLARTVVLTRNRLQGWEAEWREHEVPPPKVPFLASRLGSLLLPEEPLWPDPLLTWMQGAAGRLLPASFLALARRVLEDPAGYPDLKSLEARGGVSAGALKGRFRRRDLPSPFDYLRWCRVLVAAHLLEKSSRSVGEAAELLGMGTSGNLCRYVLSTTGMSPGHFRWPGGRETLHLAFRWRLLGLESLREWDDLDLGLDPTG